jgi:type II secretory pathway component GspD/PulD (secretin)
MKIRLSKLIAVAWAVTVSVLLISACDTPDRLPQDISVDNAKPLIKERLIAPLAGEDVDNGNFTLPVKSPRRQLLQVRYHEKSLYQDHFLRALKRLATINIAEDAPLPASFSAASNISEEAAIAPSSGAGEALMPDALKDITIQREIARQTLIDNENHQLEVRLRAQSRHLIAQLVEKLAVLESDLQARTEQTRDKLNTLQQQHIPGLTPTPPDRVFGMDLTVDADGYFALPPHLALLGSGDDGVVSSKLGHARRHLNNVSHSIRISQVPLPEAIRFISQTAGLPTVISPEVEAMEDTISLSVEVGALSALDAILQQYDIAMIFDPELEVAQIYTDAEFNSRLARVMKAIESHNAARFQSNKIDHLQRRQRITATLLTGIRRVKLAETGTSRQAAANKLIEDMQDAEKVLERALPDHSGTEAMLRAVATLSSWSDNLSHVSAPASEPTTPSGRDLILFSDHLLLSPAVQDIHHHRAKLTDQLARFDQNTQDILSGKINPSEVGTLDRASLAQQNLNTHDTITQGGLLAGFDEVAILDPCITPGAEIFTEKVAVYGGANAMKRTTAILDAYFAAAPPDNTDNQAHDDGNTPSPLPEDNLTSSEASVAPAETDDKAACKALPRPSPSYVEAGDASGYIVTGYNDDIELLVRLVEQFDRPQRQILIEVYMINVVKDFNRKLDLSFQTDALATDISQTGGFFLRRDLTDLSHSVTSTQPGGFVSGLISPNHQVEALVDFIETNNLGQTISSPTILVEEGGSASVTRTSTKPLNRVTQQTIFDINNNPIIVPVTETIDESVSFTLEVEDVTINPNNNNVTLQFSLKDQSFETTLANVDSTTGKTEDAIKTRFIAAPGDVIILAGLFKQTDSTNATGLPGTTKTNLPTAFLLGGEDQVSNTVEEMIILMAPTVIEPEVGITAPNSALGQRP